MQRNGALECSVCRSKVAVPSPRSVSRAYDKHRSKISSKYHALNVLLVSGDCILVGLQVVHSPKLFTIFERSPEKAKPVNEHSNSTCLLEIYRQIRPILVFMSKVDGKFQFSPISVNFLTEVAKVVFAIIMLIIQSRKQKVGEKPLLSLSTFVQAARNNVLLAVPALLYAINNYLKFIMQLYFNPATVKMLSNLKVLVIAVLLKIIMRRKFSIIQWEALALLLIGISVNQLRSIPEGTKAFGLPVTAIAYAYTLIFVTVPSFASVYNEYALKSQFDTSIYLQNLFLYGYGAIFNFLGILGTVIFQGPDSFDILRGHSRATLFLICNNAAQGILSSFFFKYADTILKKYSSTVATIFTGLASAAFLGQPLTVNFLLGISIVFISMHQFFSPLAKVKDEKPAGAVELGDTQNHRSSESSFVNMTAGAADDASHLSATDERKPLLPI
ncbi:hypothetical protein U9M48_033035 [Paspalum notatum var. saurae]|uniref:Uncharacterized protein n=1 Tax=Paspalum notatum var. saurae TaxID=547442 RepID=A0AAQ3X6A2_PASNO